MPATSKSGGKNKKFGRHSRNPSSKLYTTLRFERNARLRLARHLARNPNAKGNTLPCPRHPGRGIEKQFVVFSAQVPQHRGPWYAAILDGRILSCGSLTEVTQARKESMDPRVYIVRRDLSTLNRVEV